MNAPRDLPREPVACKLRRVLLLDLEPSMAALLAEWLAADDLAADSNAALSDPAPALIVIDLPFPRQADHLRLDLLRRDWPGVPVLLLSPTLMPGVPPQGEVARALGVAAVLPSPVGRAALRAAVLRLLDG
jgi:CheY-like chemotaxis protein